VKADLLPPQEVSRMAKRLVVSSSAQAREKTKCIIRVFT
jgi:hypothetical protein